MKNKTRLTLKKVGAILTLLAITSGNVKAEDELNNLGANINESFQEWGNPEFGDYLKEEFYKLPPYILDFIDENYMHIVIMESKGGTESIYNNFYNKTVSSQNDSVGITIPDLFTSFIEGCLHSDFFKKEIKNYEKYNDEEFNKNFLKFNLIHEIGHLFDVYYNYQLSSSKEFKKIYKNELNLFVNVDIFLENIAYSKAYVYTKKEYFATVFACYFHNPTELQINCPETYNYISSFINVLKLNYQSKNL